MELYHILVKTKDNEEYSAYDLEKTEEEIINIYIEPYVNDKEFFLERAFLKKENIKEFVVKKTKNKISYLKKILKNPIFKTSVTGYSLKVIADSISGENIISYLIKKATDRKEIVSNNLIKNNKVFIVHGRNVKMRENVARYIEKLGLEAIILHEQANLGLTIIEKIERNTDVGFGIILYSACDLGKYKKEVELRPRARQNVIFEHGFLIGKLGRENVIALNEDGVELPSDISGVVYIPYNEEWKLSVFKELSSRGYNVDIKNI